jgi:hypothetical protein
MVIIPKEQPVIENLNSFYVDIDRLLEHYQGEMVSGGVYLKSVSTEAAVFFDNNAILGGVYVSNGTTLNGDEAVDRIISDCKTGNFSISVFEIDPARISYWANIPSAQRIYDNLSTEFTDLQGLMKKMGKEKLTGYIEVVINNEDGKQAWVFFQNGMIIGGVDTWERSNLDRTGEYLKRLIAYTKNSSGIFHVCKVVMGQETASKGEEVVVQLQKVLTDLEDQLKSRNISAADFERELRKKLVDHADRFAFLDPFAGEFSYAERKLSFEGEASNKELVEGTLTCVLEMAKENEALDSIKQAMQQCLRKHGNGAKIEGLE